MQAATRTRYGPPEVVSVVEVDAPAPVADQVLVRVHAASVNRADLDQLYPRWGWIRPFYGLRRPRPAYRRIGLDAAGVVEAIGPAVTRFRTGDRVFADLYAHGQGAFAELVCAAERAFEPMPDGLSFEDAATLPHAGVLALHGLRYRDGRTIRAGDRVLIVGASGNVGPFAIQIAKALGAVVTGVASGPKLEFVRSLGADEVIDYTTVDPTRTDERYDWIVDVDAHEGFLAWRRALRPGGVYVAMGGSTRWLLEAVFAAPVISRATGRSMALVLWWKPFRHEDVERLTELVMAGQVRPAIDRRFPLSQVVAALRHVDDGLARGKVVITIADG